MRHILIFSAAMLIFAAYVARFADQAMMAAPPAPTPRAATVETVGRGPEPTGYGRSMTLDADRQGHFRVEARIDGRPLDFIVDTGASLVILRESAASQVGIHPMPVNFTATVSTANGKIKAAPATLDRVQLGDITVYDVRALVLPDEALSQNLLGVSFLSKLRRYEYANGRMLLEQ
jgi:aspartyl protease family protein